jgi:predicted small lipoprotein YifL
LTISREIQIAAGLARTGQSLYGAARIGDFVVNRNYRPTTRGWAIILLGTAVLALGGCGRKGGLDLPPTASSDAAAIAQANADHEPVASKPTVFDPSYGAEAMPATPRGTKRSFILDPLLGN